MGKRAGLVVVGVSAVALAGCADKTDVSKAVDKANSALASQGVKLSCPKTVDTNSEFDCTYTGTQTGKTATVKFHLTGNNHDTLDVVDVNASDKAKEEVTGQGGGSQSTGTDTTGTDTTGTDTTGTDTTGTDTTGTDTTGGSGGNGTP